MGNPPDFRQIIRAEGLRRWWTTPPPPPPPPPPVFMSMPDAHEMLMSRRDQRRRAMWWPFAVQQAVVTDNLDWFRRPRVEPDQPSVDTTSAFKWHPGLNNYIHDVTMDWWVRPRPEPTPPEVIEPVKPRWFTGLNGYIHFVDMNWWRRPGPEPTHPEVIEPVKPRWFFGLNNYFHDVTIDWYRRPQPEPDMPLIVEARERMRGSLLYTSAVAPAVATYFTVTHSLGGVRYVYNFPLNNLDATADPGVNNDASAGYAPGSLWINRTANTVWFCVDGTVGAALWISV